MCLKLVEHRNDAVDAGVVVVEAVECAGETHRGRRPKSAYRWNPGVMQMRSCMSPAGKNEAAKRLQSAPVRPSCTARFRHATLPKRCSRFKIAIGPATELRPASRLKSCTVPGESRPPRSP